MGESEAQEAYVEARNGIVEAAKAHAEATRGGDPASTFVGILRSLFDAKRAFAKNRESGNNPPPRCLQVGWEDPDAAGEDPDEPFAFATSQPAFRAEFVGWADARFLYLDKEAAYAVVSGFSQRGNTPFGIKPKALWEAMFRSGKSLADSGRNDTTTRIGGSSRRVIQIPRELDVGEDEAS